EHRILGYILIPYLLIKQKNQQFHSISEIITLSNIHKMDIAQHERAKKIAKIYNEITETAITSVFSKKLKTKEFFLNIEEKLLNDHIRPYIEYRLVKIIQELFESNIPLYFKNKRYSSVHEEDRIHLVRTPTEPVFNFTKNNELTYFLSLYNNGEELKIYNKAIYILSKKPCFLVMEHNLFRIQQIDAKKLIPFITKKYIMIPKSSEKKYFETFILNSIKKYRVNARGFKINKISPVLTCQLQLVRNLNDQPVFSLIFIYGDKTFDYFDQHSEFVYLEKQYDEYAYTVISRNKNLEDAKYNVLKSLGLEKSNQFIQIPSSQENVKTITYDYVNWINTHHSKLLKNGIVPVLKNNDAVYFKENIKLMLDIEKKSDWFDIYAEIYFGEYKIPFIKIKRNILTGNREFKLPNGEIAILPVEWFEKYKELYEFGKVEGNHLKLNKFHYRLIENKQIGNKTIPFNHLEKLINFENLKHEKLPENINAELRNYQKIGFSWLTFLKKQGFGGCLADDMGLGKTIQTLALLMDSKEKVSKKIHIKKHKDIGIHLKLFTDDEMMEENKREYPTSLIIVPTSLVHNWYNEIEKFTPDLKTYLYTGAKRTKQQSDFSYFDVIITTYGLVRNDLQVLQNFNFHYIILDEGQVIKNPSSKIYRCILKLKSEFKLVLTGTPIENSLIDLWAQLNFINRGILGSLSYFKNEFLNPIEKSRDEEKEKLLKYIIQPFILRRTKSQVAKDLPPVNEQIVYCNMTSEQNEFYEKEKSKIRNFIFENIEKTGLNKSAIAVLQGLSKLRQLANHPVLISKEYRHNSGKYIEITRRLKNVVAENHKVLVFSSFVKHLEIFIQYLKKEGIIYTELTGETINREKIVSEFQSDTTCRVFLISLKAGGVGLNLTAADYIFILEPWWNPAVENQAINRAHRIGQDKKVFVYRFITQNSIEEKIQKLKEKKSMLADEFINTNNPFKNIDENQVKELFE
ncbi:SNF2-related protein, partial [Bacteroidota bacterium]